MLNLDLTEPQSEFFSSAAEYVAAVAGYGAGKSHTLVSKIVSCMLAFRGIDLGYFAPSLNLVATIFYPALSEALTEVGIGHVINKQLNIVYTESGFGNIVCKPLNHPEQVIGFNIGMGFIDELDVLPTVRAMEAVQKVRARCRLVMPTGIPNQINIATTPEGFKATYSLFKKDPLPGSHLVRMPTRSNPHLPKDYVDSLFKMYPAALREAYLEGHFCNLTAGRVYYTFDRKVHCCKSEAQPGDHLHVGVDFNVGKNSALIVVERGDEIHAIDEIHGLYDTPDTIRALHEKYPNFTIYCYPDASGHNRHTTNASLTDHELLRQGGFNVRVNGVNPSVKDRIINVNRLIETGKFKINVDRCPEYTACLEQRPYDTMGLPDKSQDLDHLADCGEYVISFLRPIYRVDATVLTNIRGRY